MVELLLKHGADPHQVDKNGEIPLHRASRKGYFKVTEKIVESVDEIKRKDMINQVDQKNGMSCLYFAVMHNRYEVAEYSVIELFVKF